MTFAAVHESGSGTNRTSSDVRLGSANRGKADYVCSERVFPSLTQNGHQISGSPFQGTIEAV